MYRMMTAAAICLGIAGPTAAWAAEDEVAKEVKRLEGVWASKPPSKGRGRGHVLYFQGGRLAWRSFQTEGGKPVIGHANLCEVRLDPKASPKRITLTMAGGKGGADTPGHLLMWTGTG